MDYEKSYNEALDRARQFMSEHPTRAEADLMIALFPELAESKDERVRKWIYNVIESLDLPADEDAEKELEEMQPRALAYLEKQKELTEQIVPGYPGHYFYDGEKLHLLSTPATEENPYDFAMSQQEKQKPAERSEDEKTAREIKEFILYKAGHLLDEDTEHRFIEYLEKQKEPHYTKRNALFDKCVENCDPAIMKRVSDEVDAILEKEQSEDERIRKGMITYLKNMKYNAELSGGDTSICDKWINYLERQSVWESPIMTHEMIMGKQKEQSLRDFIDDFPYSATQKEQKPVEWSEEDGAKLGALINYFEGDALDYSTDDIVDWLKSLRPHWKPSEEQIGILGKVFAGCQLKDSERDSMVDLFYHLKDMI